LTNRLCSDGAQWVAQLRDRIERHEGGSPQFRLNLWRQLFDTASYNKHFQAPEEEVWSYNLPGSLDIVTNRALSKSYIAMQPDDVKTDIRADIKDIIQRGDGLKWSNEAQGIFEYPYKTYVVIARKK